VRTYDTDGKVTQIDSAGLKTYAYDDAFRITGITDTVNGANSYTYGYDALDRLTSAVKTGTTRGWTYDANGNRLTETGASASTYTISGTNNRVSSITGALPRTYTYDAAGNVLTYATVTATYNNRGRMKTLKKGSSTETIVWNALGQRVKVSGGTPGTVLYWYDEAGHLLGEYSSTGALVEETIWMGDIPVATIRPGTPAVVYYVHTDHLNTPRRVSRPSDNKLMWTWYSDAFGADLPNENPASGGTFKYNLRFPGQLYDSHAGLNQNYFRDYDPAIGRYVQSDPIGLGAGVNTYAYVYGEPVNSTDPTGLDVIITVHRQGISATGKSIYGTVEALSTLAPLRPVGGLTMENTHAGKCHCKDPIPAGNYNAFVRRDHTPNRVELLGVQGYTYIQIHDGSYPKDFEGCIGVGDKSSLDFINGSKKTLQAIIDLIRADGSGRIIVNVDAAPFGPTLPSPRSLAVPFL
jgi:RHS repeat-associated protein